jgi:ribosomal protein S18 acetylase RimI-like enzyme
VKIYEPIPLTIENLEPAAEVMEGAFAADPGLLFVLPDSQERNRLGSSLSRAMLRYCIRCGSPLTTPPPIRGVALWFAPEAAPPTRAELDETGIGRVPRQIGQEAWSRFERMLVHLDALHLEHAPDPHWYLAMLGVDPSHQRKGIGEQLMLGVFQAADSAGLACYLEAPTAGNARYYARRGFEVVAETDIPDSDVHVWMMRRDPRSG